MMIINKLFNDGNAIETRCWQRPSLLFHPPMGETRQSKGKTVMAIWSAMTMMMVTNVVDSFWLWKNKDGSSYNICHQ